MNEEIIDIHCGWGATAVAPQWNDAEHVQAGLRARGIGTAFVASDLARHFDPVHGNEQISRGTEQVANLRPWLVVSSDRPAEANALMRRYLYHNDNFVGCALYPDPVTGHPITLVEAYEFLSAFRRFAKPLLIQAPTGEAMQHVGEIAREMNTTRVIASGMGGDDWRLAVDVAAKHLNLYLDISGALQAEKIDHAVHVLHGARKLLFGSGAPHTDPAAVLALLTEIDLPAEDRVRILSQNARRIFQMEIAVAEDTDMIPIGAPTPDAEAPLSDLHGVEEPEPEEGQA